eukprot:3332850-Rhodomonas_salina.4
MDLECWYRHTEAGVDSGITTFFSHGVCPQSLTWGLSSKHHHNLGNAALRARQGVSQQRALLVDDDAAPLAKLPSELLHDSHRLLVLPQVGVEKPERRTALQGRDQGPETLCFVLHARHLQPLQRGPEHAAGARQSRGQRRGPLIPERVLVEREIDQRAVLEALRQRAHPLVADLVDVHTHVLQRATAREGVGQRAQARVSDGILLQHQHLQARDLRQRLGQRLAPWIA